MGWLHFLLCLTGISFANAKLRLDDEGQPIGSNHTISSTCGAKQNDTVHNRCWGYLSPLESGGVEYVYLGRVPKQWQVLEADGGGYHIRHCHDGRCLYWTDPAPGKEEWDWMTLTDQPSTRFNITTHYNIYHKLYERRMDKYGQQKTRKLSDVREGTAYTIDIIEGGKFRHMSSHNKMLLWMIKDDEARDWLIDPPLQQA